jgi:hypothetical protein
VVWVGDFSLHIRPHWLRWLAIGEGAAIITSGALGLTVLCWQARPRGAAPGIWGLPLALLGLAAVPALMLIKDREHPYQFFKVLVTVSPLWAVGLTAWACSLVQHKRAGLQSRPALHRLTVCVCCSLAVGTLVAAGGSLWSAVLSSFDLCTYRSSQHLATDRDFLALRDYLTPLHGQNIVYRAPAGQRYQHLWIMYYARHNQLWLVQAWHNDAYDLEKSGGGAAFLDLGTLPPDCLVLSPRNSIFLRPPKDLPAANIVWQSAAHVVWKPAATPWAALTDVQGADAVGQTDDYQIFLKKDPTRVRLYASASGRVDLSLDLTSEIAAERSKTRVIAVLPDGSEQYFAAAAGDFHFSFAVQRGLNNLYFRTDDNVQSPANRSALRLVVRDVLWKAP